MATTKSVGKSFGPCVRKFQHRIYMYLIILHFGTHMYLPVSHHEIFTYLSTSLISLSLSLLRRGRAWYNLSRAWS